MSCARTRQMLDALIDQELDAATAKEIETHLGACPACTGLHAERIALAGRIRLDAPYFPAPASLRGAIAGAADHGDIRPRPAARVPWKPAGWLTAAAAAGLLAGLWLGGPPPDSARKDLAVASHVASLAPHRQLIEIASADRHAIKPWFSGKIDFSPPVRDLAGEGFVLTGARLDHVGDRQAAAVVYRMRNHDINLFVWRSAADARREEIAMAAVRGFAVATWARDGLRYAAVSDLDARDLERFARLVSQPP
jgi:anti-sigma factor RsiW